GHLKVPSFLIGLTIVAMGTSAPEAAVSLTASFSGASDISVGNIVGSNLFNFLVVVGISALILPSMIDREILFRDLWWSIAAAVLLLIVLLDGKIARYEGILLFGMIVLYLFWIVRSAIKEHNKKMKDKETSDEPVILLSPPRSVFYVLFGLGCVILGGNLTVSSASDIAASLGMDNTLIGLTVVAIGTSLPELVTSVVAASKKNSGLALGNVVGSNIFNIFFILGASSLIRPITAGAGLWVDLVLLMVVSLSLFVFCRRKMKIGRVLGASYLVIYAVYAVYIVLRGTGRL
ncbi:MAG: calcium/sodium antiporter, partial [Eubacteriales bacterium]